MNERDSVEVCIVTYGNRTTIGPCIQSLTRIVGDVPVRVAVCDNHPDESSLDAAASAAARCGIEIRTIERRDNPGFAVACNELAASSSATRLVFLNPDAEITAWPGIGLLGEGLTGATVIGPDGREQPTYGIDRSLRDELLRRLQVPPRRPEGRGYVSGAAMVISAELFRRVGGFDERFFMYYEDIDLCQRLTASGAPVCIDPSFVVRHVGAFSSSRDQGAATLRSYESGKAFFRKWRGSSRGFSALVAVDGSLRIALYLLRLPIPGAEGARVVVPHAVRDTLRRSSRDGDV